MKVPPLAALLAIAVSVTSCAPTASRTGISTRPAVSGTAYEMIQAKQERERDDAARAAEATQRQIDDLKKEVDSLKQREREAWVNKLATPQNPVAARQSQPAPAVPQASPRAKAIDAEVAKIMAGKHGQLPPAQKLSSNNSGVASIRVTNDTDHTLTVSYSGPTTRQSVLAPHKSESITLTAGGYSVAASVDDPSVIPFAGKDTLSGGDYTNQFYIVTSSR